MWGSNAANLMREKGYKITGIAEYDGGLFNPNGIDICSLLEHRQRNGTVLGFKGAEPADSHELLTTDCEILIPAATENVITSRNADRIKARIICEGAVMARRPLLRMRFWRTRRSLSFRIFWRIPAA